MYAASSSSIDSLASYYYAFLPSSLIGKPILGIRLTRLVDFGLLYQQNLTRLNSAQPESRLLGLAHDLERPGCLLHASILLSSLFIQLL